MKQVITVRGVVFAALFTALTITVNFLQVHLWFSPVPITLGNLAVMLAGAILGAGYGFFSLFLMIVLVAVGLPFLDGSGGLSALLSASGGYVWMWPLCALFTGLWATRARGSLWWQGVQIFLAAEIFGSWLCYVTGVPWLAHVVHLPLGKALVEGCWPYLPGDTAKAVVTAIVAVAVKQVYPASRLVGRGASSVVSLVQE